MGRPAAERQLTLLIARACSVAAAACLVGTVALATLLPIGMTLHEGLHAIDAAGADEAQRSLIGTVGKGVWNAIFVPVLMRPVWMGPLFLGLLSLGGALSASFQAPPHTKRRQS
jgi:hypothetical protein